ncbi:DUF6642 family protein [Peijinzhouia sedimentorum]
MHGIFCLEGMWFGDHRDLYSVSPILDLVHRLGKIPFIHHRCGTYEEFEFSIKRWRVKSFHRKFPILNIAFHGDKGEFKVGKELVTLDDLAELLGGKCEGCVIYFGSCDTMRVDRRLLQKFMEQTKIIAVLGYKSSVSWLQSAAFEIQMLYHFSQENLDAKGLGKIKSSIFDDTKHLAKELEFRMEINERTNFK